MRSKNRLSTFRMMSLSFCCVNVARNAALPPASSMFCGKGDSVELISVASSCAGVLGPRVIIVAKMLMFEKCESQISKLQAHLFYIRDARAEHSLECCGSVIYIKDHNIGIKPSCGYSLTNKPCMATVRFVNKYPERLPCLSALLEHG
jgi:hypothetical protein